MTVQHLIQEDPAPLRASDTVEAAVEHFGTSASSIRHLPVIDADERLLGLLAERQLRDVAAALPIGTLPLAAPVSVLPDVHPFEAAALLASHNQSVLAVTDEDGGYLGLLIRANLFDRLSHLLSTDKAGAIVVIEMLAKDYSLGQLVYVIEQNDVKILSITSEIDQATYGQARLTLKLNVSDTARVRHVLAHYGYYVVEYFDDTTAEDLQLRVQEFMRYLEV